MSINETALCAIGTEVIRTEADALLQLADRIDATFAKTCALMLSCKGRVVVTGIGKSGHIGRKLAATLASTGTPAFFVHATEMSHGDIGMITSQDCLIALSNSGETRDLITLLPLFERMRVVLIAITGSPRSRLANAATVHIDVGGAQEACPLGLSPTTSTTATLAMGDALAIALLKLRKFDAQEFALLHPAGSLGRRLLPVSALMHTGDQLPQVSSSAALSTALAEMSRTRLGMIAVVTSEGELCGIFTDGDLRRALCDAGHDIKTATIGQLMTKKCISVAPDTLAVEGLRIMREQRINGLLVISEQQLLGALNIHDLLQAGVL